MQGPVEASVADREALKRQAGEAAAALAAVAGAVAVLIGLYVTFMKTRFGVMARLRSSSLIVVAETPIRLGGSSFGDLPIQEG